MPCVKRQQGNEQISIRVTDEQYAFIRDRGGAKLVRKLIIYENTKKGENTEKNLDKTFEKYSWGMFGAESKRINVRLQQHLHAFIKQMGGAPYIRALLQSYIEYLTSIEVKSNPL